MKLNLIILLLCGLLTSTLTAQNPENNKILRGKVLFQNSNFTPAVDVSIEGLIKLDKEEKTNKVYTDSKGQYELKFPLARKGHPVTLTIGKEDSKGQQLEVVNQKEISLCRIPANASQEFKVIVCPKGARDLAAWRYYKILKSSAELAYEKLQEEFRELTKAQNKDYKTIQEVADDLTKLQIQLSDSIALYKEAMTIASINKDGVNERVLKYLKLLDEGKSLQEAREALSISKASKDMDKGIKLFRAGVKELEERARASAAVFDYKDAVVCYDTLISKAEKLNIDKLELSGYYLEIGEYNREGGYYQKALENAEKAIKTKESSLETNHPDLARSYHILSLILNHMELYEESLKQQLKAVEIFESFLETTHPTLATAYNNISLIYLNLGDYKKAMFEQQNALKIRELMLGPNHLDLANSYSNFSMIYWNLEQYQEALIKQQKAVEIFESTLESNHPNLAIAYNVLSVIYTSLEYYDEALLYQRKAIKIGELVLESNHPYLATSYNNLSIIYYKLEKYHNAIKQGLKALKIKESAFDINISSMGILYYNLGKLYYVIDRPYQSIHYLNKALIVWKKTISYKYIGNIKIKNAFNDLIFIYKELAKTQFFDTKYQEALKSLDTVTKYQKDAEAWSYKGLCHYFLKEYQKAIKAHQRAAIIDPLIKTQHYYNYVGAAYAKNQQFIEAKAAFIKYQKLFPNKGWAYRNWAMYYALQNQKENALNMLEKAIKLGYKNREWLQTDASMQNLKKDSKFKELLESIKITKE